MLGTNQYPDLKEIISPDVDFSKIFPDKPDESDNIVEPIRLFRGSEEVDKLRISSPEIFKSKFGSSKKSEL